MFQFNRETLAKSIHLLLLSGMLLAAKNCWAAEENRKHTTIDDLLGTILKQQTTDALTVEDLINQVFNATKSPGISDNVSSDNEYGGSTGSNGAVDFGGTGGGGGVFYKSCGAQKACVPRNLCNTGNVPTTGENFINIRISGQCHYLEECCDISDIMSAPPTIQPTHVDSSNHQVNELTKSGAYSPGCGIRNINGVGFRITGAKDNETEFGEFPWMVAILRDQIAFTHKLYFYACGGALIAADIVVTAAHCVSKYPAADYFVRAGEWDTQTRSESIPHQNQRVKDIVIHEDYHKGALHNDIAIVFLKEPFILGETVRPICLPPANSNFNHALCYATGWGKDEFGQNGKYQVILKKIDLPVVPHDKCQESLRKTILGKYFKLDESFICAGGELGKDACQGDGGSPLVCPIVGDGEGHRYYHVGIVAWGIGCGQQDLPGVYVNVPHLRHWLDEKLKERNVDFTPFTA